MSFGPRHYEFRGLHFCVGGFDDPMTSLDERRSLVTVQERAHLSGRVRCEMCYDFCMKIGYARVSDKHQKLDRQIAAL